MQVGCKGWPSLITVGVVSTPRKAKGGPRGEKLEVTLHNSAEEGPNPLHLHLSPLQPQVQVPMPFSYSAGSLVLSTHLQRGDLSCDGGLRIFPAEVKQSLPCLQELCKRKRWQPSLVTPDKMFRPSVGLDGEKKKSK